MICSLNFRKAPETGIDSMVGSWEGCFADDCGGAASGLFCSDNETDPLNPALAIEPAGTVIEFLNVEGLGNELSLLEAVSGSVTAIFFGVGFNLGGCVSVLVVAVSLLDGVGAAAGLGAIGLAFACGGEIVDVAESLVGFGGGGFSAPASLTLACGGGGEITAGAGSPEGFAGDAVFSAADGISAARAAFAFANWDMPSEPSEGDSSRGAARGGAFFAAIAGG